MQPAVRNWAAPVLTTFLSTYAEHKEVPNIHSALAIFRGKVIRMQRAYRQTRIIRSAFVSILLPHWAELQAKVHVAVVEEQALKDWARAEELFNLRKEAGALAATVGSKNQSPSKRTFSKSTAAMFQDSATGPRCEDGSTSAHQRKEKLLNGCDPLPRYVIKSVLSDYVRNMQLSYKQRVMVWTSELQRLVSKSSDEAFVGSDASGTQELLAEWKTQKPRKVYVNTAEMEPLVRSSIALWTCGGFKDLKANHRRLLTKPWKAWCAAMSISTRGRKANKALFRKEMTKVLGQTEEDDESPTPTQ